MRRDRLAAVVLASCAGVAAAQSLPPGLLEKARALPAPTQAELQRHAGMLAAMTPAQRAAFERRVAEWDALVPAAQRERREAWQAWSALPPDERHRLEEAAAAYAALPPERQAELRAQYDALDGSERRGWLLGPVLGADYPKLHAVVAQVPPHQRDDLLAALRALTAQGRADLAVLAQRIPPQQRDRLRRELLAQPRQSRDAWLRGQVLE
ncbi:MAG TPA: DUF3106 domain-containing protein [Luteimonas sp.]|nr:DUF3106 domain-containing protein [Luteimonas sp.]